MTACTLLKFGQGGGERDGWCSVNTVCVPYTGLLEGRKEKDSKSVGYDNLNIHYISFIFYDILSIFKM